MRMSEKCRNKNNSDNPLTCRRIDGGKNQGSFFVDARLFKISRGAEKLNSEQIKSETFPLFFVLENNFYSGIPSPVAMRQQQQKPQQNLQLCLTFFTEE